MLFDVEKARYLAQEYERRVSIGNLQRAQREAQQLRTAALVRLVDQGLRLADGWVMTLWHWRQNVTHSMRWLLATRNR